MIDSLSFKGPKMLKIPMRVNQRSTVAWIPFVAILFSASIPFILDFVDILGHRIPQADVSNDFLKGIMVAAALTLAVFTVPFPKEDRVNLCLVWGLKIFVTLGIMLFYEWNYGLDAYYYFEQSQRPYPDFTGTGFSRGTDNLIAALWLFENEIIRTQSYHSIKVLISFIGMLGIYAFYRGTKSYFPKVTPSLFLMLALFPSNLFWTSILGKDPLNLFGLCLCGYGVINLLSPSGKRLWAVVLLSVGLFVVAGIRAWMMASVLLPLLVAFSMSIRNSLLRYSVYGAMVIGLVLYVKPIVDSISQQQAEELVQQVDMVSKSWQIGGSAGNVPRIESIGGMLKYLPFGMLTAIFRPLPGEILNPFGIVAGLENLFLLYLLFQGVRYRREKFFSSPLNVWLLGYILIWAVLYAYVSPQNLGAAVRFKTQILPALLLLIFSLRGSFKLLPASRI